MKKNGIGRRDVLKGTAASLVALTANPESPAAPPPSPSTPPQPNPAAVLPDAQARMKWWHQAKFGMFVHCGLYSVLGRHEWVMENEGIPVKEYERLAGKLKAKPKKWRGWGGPARRAGQKYMVMT